MQSITFKRIGALILAGVAAAAMYTLTIPAFVDAQTGFGSATQQENFIALTSNTGNATTSDDYGGINFAVASGTTLGSLGELSARYNIVNGDCAGGSPRFQIAVTNGSTTGNIFAYLGPEPSYNGCTQNSWTTSGNIINGSRMIDTSQLAGGTFYDTWSHANTAYGSWTVTGVQFIVDAGWATGGLQRVRVTDIGIGNADYTFPSSTTGTSTATTTVMTPTHVSPANGSTLTSAQWSIADWSDVSASSTPVTYRYESSNSSSTNVDGSFASPIYQSGALSASQISTAGTGNGTYWWHVRAVDNAGVMSAWSTPSMVTVAATSTGTTTPPTNAQQLIDELESLQQQFPQFYWNLQWLIDDLADEGTTTPPNPPAGTPTINNNGMSVSPGGHLDFVGRNFGHEEDVRITLGGSTIRTVHADGGGNFSTGSMSAPTSSGTYLYVFTGLTSGATASSQITVTP